MVGKQELHPSLRPPFKYNTHPQLWKELGDGERGERGERGKGGGEGGARNLLVVF